MIRRFLKGMRQREVRAYFVAILIAVAAVTSALAGVWVFRWTVSREASPWQLVLSDRWAIGSLRLALVSLGLYAAISAGALIASGRWIRTLSTSGLEVDDPRSVEERVELLEARIDQLRRERDQTRLLFEEFLNG